MLKNKMYHRESFATRDEARRAVVGFIEGYYNRRRPHSSVGYGISAKLMDAFFERTAAAAETAPGEAMHYARPPKSLSFPCPKT